MNLGTLHNDISVVIARGSSQDAKVPRWTRQAARWLEQNYTFNYMKKVGEVILDPLAVSPNVVDLPNSRVKLVTDIRPYQDVGAMRRFLDPIQRVDMSEVTSIDVGGYPAGWWQVGEKIFFDTKPQAQVDLELVYAEYTDWPTDDNATPTLITRYDNLLMAQALINAWRELKDPAGVAEWTNERNFAIQAVLNAEEEAAWSGRDLRMRAS